jgi:hypothetical protein
MIVRQFDPTIGQSHDWRGVGGIGYVANYIWDTNSLTWIPQSGGSAGPSADVNVLNWPATQPVSGTVSVSNMIAQGLTDTQLRLTPVPVSGTFYQATQPVSGTFYQTTQPVSGTFWQTTQPVSGPLTDTQLRNSAVPVSGTFWQTTQPVSMASTTITGTVATSEVAPTTVSHGIIAVTTAGTRVQLATNTAKSIVVKALVGNTGTIYVGGSGVSAANGFPLAPGDTVSLDISNTNVVWLDSSINAQSAAWMANN